MVEYTETTDVIDVPRNTGMDGFLQVVRSYLTKPRVQEIIINSSGRVKVRRYVRPDDNEHNSGVDFGDLQPSFIVRNAPIEEIALLEGAGAAVILGSVLDQVAVAQLRPLAFIVGTNSLLWEWYRQTSGVVLRSHEMLHGLPLYTDREIPDSVLILAAGYGRDAALLDTKKSYKMELQVARYKPYEVDVL